ncbi:MAG TPA: 4Fe-4S dicluster domain-containing protein [Rhodanobacteraceae bacterium]|jgi:polyferredoxin|nr:4Fe-4S dicluster domain-containing protein [Rhodanobacteraceae bacterium]
MNRPIPLTVVQDSGESLYAAQPKIYPREIDGRFARLRIAAVFVLLGLFYLLPWMRWDGHQAVLFDLPARKFYVFGLTFWPQDFFWLTCLLVIAAVTLFFFTALAGRLWCGYACPQTVWTEVFLWIERFCEGRRNQRIKLDGGRWTREKFLRKSAKQFLWITLSVWTGFTFVGFFTPILDLGHAVTTFSFGGWEAFWIVFYGFATYGNAGYMREQVCKYMCPYARFQSAMFDRDTLVISYDVARGEPRGHRKRGVPSVLARASLTGPPGILSPSSNGGEKEEGTFGVPPKNVLGDCIACDACVQVCPTGIDIRDGLQIECIACAACIDACDSVMDKMDYPRGLIRYTTESLLAGMSRRILRPRTAIYATILGALLVAFTWGISHRAALIVDVLHDRNALYREMSDGGIENGYTVKLVNKTDQTQQLRIALEDDQATLRIVGKTHVTVEAGQVANIPLTLHADRADITGRRRVELLVRNDDDSIHVEHKSEFFAPEEK